MFCHSRGPQRTTNRIYVVGRRIGQVKMEYRHRHKSSDHAFGETPKFVVAETFHNLIGQFRVFAKRTILNIVAGH